jgi:hypothetical protein
VGERTSTHFHETTFTCFTITAVTPFIKKRDLKLDYFAYFHSIMSDGYIFWEIHLTGKELSSSIRNY